MGGNMDYQTLGLIIGGFIIFVAILWYPHGERHITEQIKKLEAKPKRKMHWSKEKWKEIKKELFDYQGGRCEGCGNEFEWRNLVIDHIVPVSKGGGDHINNLQLLCDACNRLKGTGTQKRLWYLLAKQRVISWEEFRARTK